MNPYRIPPHDPLTIVHFSGGKTSGYLLAKILEAHGGRLPDNARAAFTNTGKEIEATLRFIRDFELEMDCPIAWLEFDIDPDGKGTAASPAYIHRVVDYDSASRGGNLSKEWCGERSSFRTSCIASAPRS